MLITTKSGSFEMEEQDSLLDELEKNGYVVEYQCRNGYCGSCRLKLKKGKVSYEQAPLAFLFPDEILPCCCTVQENLFLEISHPSSVGTSWQKDLFNFQDLFEYNEEENANSQTNPSVTDTKTET